MQSPQPKKVAKSPKSDGLTGKKRLRPKSHRKKRLRLLRRRVRRPKFNRSPQMSRHQKSLPNRTTTKLARSSVMTTSRHTARNAKSAR